MQNEEYVQANRQAWNETEAYHRQASFTKLLNECKSPDFNVLDDQAKKVLQQIDVQGKNVIQLCCNNGREILSIKNMGAARCVGFDLSDAFISQANELSQVSGIDCEFYQGDANRIPSEFNGKFDLVFISVGALGWIPDISEFVSGIKKLLVPKGWLFIYEMHPILDMFDGEPHTSDYEFPVLKYSYFKEDPFIENTGLDYLGKTTYESLTTYWFHHKLSDIFQACLRNGFTITDFQEFPHDLSETFSWLQNVSALPPLSYILTARS
jgi:ubiquinone/menaquinone biosynthesis C-methylase UbiE